MSRFPLPIAIAAMILLLACDFSGEPSEPPMEVRLSQIANDYMKNEAKAEATYNKPLITSARVRTIKKNGLELSLGGRSHVEADFKDTNDLVNISRGDVVLLQCAKADGSSDSLGAFVYLKKCSIVKNGEEE